MGTNETAHLINYRNNNQDLSLRERVSKYLLPVMVAVIALVVTALTATVATSITMATYNRCYQESSSCMVNVNSCSTPPFTYDISGYYNMDMRCEYEAVNTNISYIQVSTSLQLDGKGGHPNVKCWCQASLQLWAVSKYNRTLASDQCSIVITRCPVYMSI